MAKFLTAKEIEDLLKLFINCVTIDTASKEPKEIEDLLELYYINCVTVDTASKEPKESEESKKAPQTPSTPGQLELAKFLTSVLQVLGLTNIEVSEFGYLTAELPANNSDPNYPVLAFLAHLDTYHGLSGEVKPQVIDLYDGGDIMLEGSKEILCPDRYPYLQRLKGVTVITSDGTSVLGADDKAGIAAIITAIKYFVDHPEIQHGKILVGFFPDEEISGQAQNLDLEKFQADIGFTFDGSDYGQVTAETFHGESAIVTIEGKDAHPGEHGEDLLNAIHAAAWFIEQIPRDMQPHFVSGRKGFIHPIEISGDVNKVTIRFILRDFEAEKVEKFGDFLRNLATDVDDKQQTRTTVEVKPSYPNYREELRTKYPYAIDLAVEAVQEVCSEAKLGSARGGTDGSSLTFRGLPTPDIFTGMQNYHTLHEFIGLSDMAAAAEVAITLALRAGRYTAQVTAKREERKRATETREE